MSSADPLRLLRRPPGKLLPDDDCQHGVAETACGATAAAAAAVAQSLLCMYVCCRSAALCYCNVSYLRFLVQLEGQGCCQLQQACRHVGFQVLAVATLCCSAQEPGQADLKSDRQSP